MGEVSKVEVEHIFDLHGANTQHWVDEMNRQFDSFGVKIHHFTVKMVTIPSEMAQDFEDKTLYESKTLEKEMEQVERRLKLNNDEALEKVKRENYNAKRAGEEQTLTTKARLMKEVAEVKATTEKTIAVMGTERESKVNDLLSVSHKEVTSINLELFQLETSTKAEIHKTVDTLKAETDRYGKTKVANAKLNVVGKISEGRRAIAESEGAAASGLEARRNQDAELVRLNILDNLAKNSKIHIATSAENNMGLAPDNSLVTQVAHQGLEAVRSKLAEMTTGSISKLHAGKKVSGGLVRPELQEMD